MRRFYRSQFPRHVRTLTAFPWESKLTDFQDSYWYGIGKSVVEVAHTCDMGKAAFDECCIARHQLESIVHSLGYDMNVYIFGGLVTLGILEVGGDVDFVGVSDIEPGFDEAAEIISRTSREFRRIGLKTKSLPKARVPVVKADRVSKDLPGTPFHNLSCDGIFQFNTPLNTQEVESFEILVNGEYGAIEVEWNATYQFATVRFNSTTSLVHGLSHIKKLGGIDIPIRLPVDTRHGPEIYRIPFDFCLSATGLRNSYLLSEALTNYQFSRHLLLTIKKWGRCSGVINSIDGLLASYALTIMLAHYLIKVGKLHKLSANSVINETQLLQASPEYRPLAHTNDGDLSEVGFLLAGFFEYYGNIFNYTENVVCTTNVALTKAAMHWDHCTQNQGHPPFFELAIKDPYGLDNIGRNLNHMSVNYVQEAHQLALKHLLNSADFNPIETVGILTHDAPQPHRGNVSPIRYNNSSSDKEARHALSKMEFHQRKKSLEQFGKKAMINKENHNLASNVTKNVLGWIRSDD